MNFHRNLTYLEIESLERLMSSLTLVHLSPSVLDTRAWSLSSLVLFSIIFLVLSNLSIPSPLSFNRICMEIGSLIKGQGFCMVSGSQEGKHQ